MKHSLLSFLILFASSLSQAQDDWKCFSSEEERVRGLKILVDSINAYHSENDRYPLIEDLVSEYISSLPDSLGEDTYVIGSRRVVKNICATNEYLTETAVLLSECSVHLETNEAMCEQTVFEPSF